MSVLAKSAVSLATQSIRESEWIEGGAEHNSHLWRRIKLTGVSVGGATNTIGAAALGFSELLNCSSFYDTTNNKIIPAMVDPVNGVILLGAGTANAIGDLSNVTGYINVHGVPAIVPTA